MSHLPIRKEPVCLNCGTETLKRFCPSCGQENIEPKETVWHFVTHFINDVTHFDGKFFSTIKLLFLKPGLLSKEYVKGKRVRYLNPVRMYLFTSFLFFLIFLSIFKIDENKINGNLDFNSTSSANAPLKIDSIKNNSLNVIDSSKKDIIIETPYSTREQYDSLLKTGKIKDSWLERKFTHQQLDVNKKYVNNKNIFKATLIESIAHNFPKMLFISLPFAALILQLLYIRRKQFYYVGHGIFIIHFYTFIFLFILLGIGLSKILSLLNVNFNLINVIIFLITLFYLYKSMHNFYGQSKMLTIAKWFVFLASFFIIIMALTVLLLFFSFLQV